MKIKAAGRPQTPTPAAAVARALAAGAAGTAVMTVYQTAVARLRGTPPSTTPAEVGKRVIRGVFHRRFDESQTPLLNNLMHWGYGTGWGSAYALTDGMDLPLVARASGFGALVWGASVLELPALKLAPPVWDYPPVELALDISYHLAYALAVAAAYQALSWTQGTR